MKLMNDSGIDLCHMVLSLCYPNKNTTTMAWPTFPTFYLFTAELKQLLLVKPNCLEKYFSNILSLHWASQRVKIGEVPISFPTESSLTSFSPTRVNVKFLFVEQYTNNPSFIYYEKNICFSTERKFPEGAGIFAIWNIIPWKEQLERLGTFLIPSTTWRVICWWMDDRLRDGWMVG